MKELPLIKYDTDLEFDVKGAGRIILGSGCHSACGRAIGFSFGVSWGRHGVVGGVLGRTEAKKMAEYILGKLKDETMTESEEWEIRFPEVRPELNKLNEENIGL